MEDCDAAIRRLVEAINRVDGSYYMFARSLGVKENTLAILYALDDDGEHSQTQICEEWLIPKTTVNTIVKELVAKGYMRLCAGADAREKMLSLTDSGHAYARNVLREVYEAERQALKATLEQYSPEFIDALDCFSRQLHATYQQRLKPMHEKTRKE